MAAKTQKVEDQEPKKVPDFSTIEVTLTYPGYESIILEFRRSLGSELRTLQQTFYNKTKKEQDAEQYDNRVVFLSKLLKSHPRNLPGYDKANCTPEEGFMVYFFGKKDFEDVVDAAWTIYQNNLYPKELMSRPSE